MKKLAKRAVQTLPIFEPPLSVQRRVVSRLDSINEEVEQLEHVFGQKLDALAEFKQSLLQKAFSGELTAVPQDEIEAALA